MLGIHRRGLVFCSSHLVIKYVVKDAFEDGAVEPRDITLASVSPVPI